jgi:hypothetical protein
MSAVLVAVFADHTTAERLRTRLVREGFPTDRVELTSCQELGQAELVPRKDLGEKLTEYWGRGVSLGRLRLMTRDWVSAGRPSGGSTTPAPSDWDHGESAGGAASSA